MKCDNCEKEVKTKTDRVPTGWKRTAAGVICKDCWTSSYVLRAITVPVVEPLNGKWPELRKDLTELWGLATRTANYIFTELYARDVRRDGQEKLPPMARQYLYPEIRAKFPTLPSQAAASMEHAITRKYRARRYDLLWRGAVSLPTARFPQPYPVSSQAWSLDFVNDRPVISARLLEKRWELRLMGGARYRRQLGSMRHLVAGRATAGEAAFYKDSDGRILCKMVMWLPRPEPSASSGILYVRTAPDKLLVALDEQEERIWNYNADHLRRWISEYDWRRQRLSEDRKAEQRPVPTFAQFQATMVRRQRDRMASAVKDIAAHVSEFAMRRRFSRVEYNDADQSYVGPGFPYAEVRTRIAGKLAEFGIEFVHDTTSAVPAESKVEAEVTD